MSVISLRLVLVNQDGDVIGQSSAPIELVDDDVLEVRATYKRGGTITLESKRERDLPQPSAGSGGKPTDGEGGDPSTPGQQPHRRLPDDDDS